MAAKNPHVVCNTWQNGRVSNKLQVSLTIIYLITTAAEFRYFCLYMSLPLLGRHLEAKYVAHWRLLVKSLLIISSQSISPANLDLVDVNLRLFVVLYPMLYGPKFAGLEVHMLKHTAADGMCMFIFMSCINITYFS